MDTISDAIRRAFPSSAIRPIPEDHHYVGGEWVTPCICGHDDHGGARDETMCCDTDDCECGGWEPQPGVARPTVRREGLSPFLAMLRGLSYLSDAWPTEK